MDNPQLAPAMGSAPPGGPGMPQLSEAIINGLQDQINTLQNQVRDLQQQLLNY